MGGRGMACHARPCGEAAEGGGGVNVKGGDEAPPSPRPGSGKAAPPPRGHRAPPPPPQKAPRTATPAERAETAARRGQRGAVQERVEQQQRM